MAAMTDYTRGAGSVRADESSVRLLFVEHSQDYAALVCETLQHAGKGHFEVRHADRLDAAFDDVDEGTCDAVLVDLTAGSENGAVSIDAAESLAHRVPVIVLTGSDEEDELVDADSEAAFRTRMACSRLPGTILGAVRRYRRLGQGGANPVVLRDPLRAFARAFARLGAAIPR
jgi:DNA-binding NtrC family response regulator